MKIYNMIESVYLTKEQVKANMSDFLESIRQKRIDISISVADTMWVCDVMNNEKMGNLIAFGYETPQYATPIDALYDAYVWLIDNKKIKED